MPTIDDTIEDLRQHCADALFRAERAFAEAERFRAALRALGLDGPLDVGTAARLADAAGIPRTATKVVPDPPRPPKATKRVARARPANGQQASRPSTEEVARVADAARAAGKPMCAALAAHFGMPTTTVNNWLTKARKAGLLAATNPPLGPVPAAPTGGRSTLEGVAHLEALIAGEIDDDD